MWRGEQVIQSKTKFSTIMRGLIEEQAYLEQDVKEFIAKMIMQLESPDLTEYISIEHTKEMLIFSKVEELQMQGDKLM